MNGENSSSVLNFLHFVITTCLDNDYESLTAKLRMVRLLVSEVEEERLVGLRDGLDGLIGVPVLFGMKIFMFGWTFIYWQPFDHPFAFF